MPKVRGRRLYRDLAAKLREVDHARTRGADRSRSGALHEGGVPLARILDLLTSDEGAAALSALKARSEGAYRELQKRVAADGGASGSPFFVHPPASLMPDDPFDRELADFFSTWRLTSGGEVLADWVPQAVVEAFSGVAGDDGMVSPAEAAALGPTGERFFGMLRDRLGEVGDDLRSDRQTTKDEFLSPVTVRRLGRSRAMPGPKDRMPVLDEITRLMGGPDALAEVRMASVQHLFPSTRGLYAALGDNGLPLVTTGVGGKGYSTDADTMLRLTAEGYDVHPAGAARAHRGPSNAGEVVVQLARQQLADLFDGVDPDPNAAPRFLLLDEGGKLVKALHLYFPRHANLCVAVEQTDRGVQVAEEAAQKLAEERAVFERTGRWPEPREGYELRCSVVDMARSLAKKRWESPMIGESCVFNLEDQLDEMSPALRARLFEDPARRRASVIGYGAVGKAVADRLRARGFEVFVYDIDPAKMAQAEADGCSPVSRTEALRNAHLLYGCTGRGVLTPDDYELLPDGAVLANAASGNHELGLSGVDLDAAAGDDEERFGDNNARSTFRGLDVDLGELDDPMRHRVWRTRSGKELLLARSGYVVNMELDLPPEYAQLTRGLLLASCLVAARGGAPGLVEIPAEVQDFIVTRVKKHLVAQGGSLEAPDFRKLPAWG